MPEVKKEEVVSSEVVAEPVKEPETVSKEAYDKLLKEALALQGRYEKLAELYNIILEKFLSSTPAGK